jgi:hypothetical protein
MVDALLPSQSIQNSTVTLLPDDVGNPGVERDALPVDPSKPAEVVGSPARAPVFPRVTPVDE